MGVVEAFKQALDPRQSSDEPALLDSYCRDHSLGRGVRPDLVVYPRTRAEVQTLVRLARDTATPLVPVSSGGPHLHGASIPTAGGVIVDFTRMRRIIKLDAGNRIARIEPGVTFAELLPELDRAGQRLNVPLAPRANKSVLTSALEREVSIIPKYDFDFVDPLMTLEVVYGSGEDFRTGSAAGPGRVDEDLRADLVNPWGPAAFDYYRFVSAAQGTLGLVTWAAVRTEIKPSLRRLHFVGLAEIDTAWAPIDQILRRRVADECLLLDATTLATLLAASPTDIGRLRSALPPYLLIVGVAGYRRRPEERLALYEAELRSICAGSGLAPQTSVPGAPGLEDAVARVIAAPWSREPYWKLRRGEGAHEIFFLCPLSRFPVYVRQMAQLVRESALASLPYAVYVQPAVQGRGAQVSFNLPFDHDDRTEVEALFLTASHALMRNGAFFSRPYGPWASMVFDDYPQGAALLRRLKKVFDGAGILNPGKLCFPARAAG